MTTETPMGNFEYRRHAQETSVQYQLDFSDVLERLRKFLEGYYYDAQTKTYIAYSTDENGSPISMMNPKGIHLVMRALVALEHKGVVLSELTEDEARIYASQIHKDLAQVLFIHSHEINISPSDVKHITKLVSLNIYSALTRAIGGKTAKRLNEIVSVNEYKADNAAANGGFLR